MDTSAAERYLALLAADRPVAELEGLREELLAGDEGLSGPTDVARLHELAVSVHGLRELGRRRESELAALFDTVADLAALKDLDDVLEAIVRRVRSLLACDVSYLSLNDDEAGETYMRITQGIHTEEFRNVRLPFGAGLGGLVAQTARPYVTADYFNDERFRHTRTIDHAVSGEALTAILAVPLQLGRTVIGVLYAANHDPRPFGREDVDLLTSFAAHAAVALDNARRIEESREALADLERTSDLMRRNTEGVQRAADAHDRLAAVVLRGGTLGDVATELHQVLGVGVVISDSGAAVLGASSEDTELTVQEQGLVARAVEENHTIIEEGVAVSPASAGGAPLAALVVRGEVDDVSRRILERAAMTTALLLVVQRSVAETEARLRGDLLLDLLHGRAGAGSLTARAALLGADLARPHAVLVVDGPDPLARQAGTELTAGGGLVTEVENRLVLVLPEREPMEAGRFLAERFRRSAASGRRTVGRPRPTVGVAGPVAGADGVRSAYQEAHRCLEALLSLGRRGDVADSATLGFVGLLLGKGDPRQHVRGLLGPLLDYDRTRGTALVETVEEWLAQDRHLGRTGEALHVHPNTVTQRLDRVAQLLGPGWHEPERLLELALALRLRRVIAP